MAEIPKIEEKPKPTTTPDKSRAEVENKSPANGVEKLSVQKGKKFQELQEKLKNIRDKIKQGKKVEDEKAGAKKFLDLEIKTFDMGAGDSEPEVPNFVESQEVKEGKKIEKIIEDEALKALKEKHQAEIQDTIEKIDIDTLDIQTKSAIHTASIAGNITQDEIDKIPKEVKEKALKGITDPEGREIDISKPLTPEQTEILKLHLASEYLKSVSNLSQDELASSEKIAELEKKHPGITEFIKKQPQGSLDQKTFFESVKQNPALLKNFIHLVQENGMLMTGIVPTSSLGKEIVQVIEKNISEYDLIGKTQDDLIDVEHFKGLKDVLGGSYLDLLISREFILGEKHKLKKDRDTVLDLFYDSLAEKDIPDPKTASPEEVAEYKKTIKAEFQNATGIEGDKVETAIKHIGRNNLSPLVRFLADLIAPFGAMMPGEAGDFWRQYLKDNQQKEKDENNTTNENYEKYGTGSEGIEGLDSGSILGAANKYMGVHESKDGNLIRDMHKSGGLNAGPKTPWCMSFVQHVLRKDMNFTSEQIGTGKTASAAAGHRIGRHTDTPQLGDIVLVRREGGSGRHIGFYAGEENGKVKILGGNQSDSVCISRYSKNSVVEYRTLQKDSNTSKPDNAGLSGEAKSGNDSFPDTPIGPENYPSKSFLSQNGKTPEAVPMGMRVNNPLNIKFTGSAVQRKLFEGIAGKSIHTDQGDPQIAFKTPEAGMISGLRLLLYKQKEHGLNTIQSMVASVPWGWTQGGGSGNPLGNNAAREIAQRAGLSLTGPLDLSDKGIMKKFVQSLLFQEHGSASNIYSGILDSSIAKLGGH